MTPNLGYKQSSSNNYGTQNFKLLLVAISILALIKNLSQPCDADLSEDLDTLSNLMTHVNSLNQDVIPTTENHIVLPEFLNAFIGKPDKSWLNVGISFDPPIEYLDQKYYVPTGMNLTAMADIGGDYSSKDNLTYYWSIDKDIIASGVNMSKIVHSFNKVDDVVLSLLVKSDSNQTAYDKKKLVIREPITIIRSYGKQHLYHGDLLNWTLNFNGTGPFKYCYTHCLKKYDCDYCEPRTPLFSNVLMIGPIYLPKIDNYTLTISITNLASTYKNNLTIIIADTVRHPKILYVPIVSSILAVLILLIGVALHFKFRKTVDAETADFDFTRNAYDDEEWNEEQSFSERVRYLLFGSQPNERRPLFSQDLNRFRIR